MDKKPFDLTGALTPRQVADALGVHIETVARWRRKDRGPRYVKVGGRYRYDPDSVREWVAQASTDDLD